MLVSALLSPLIVPVSKLEADVTHGIPGVVLDLGVTLRMEDMC